MSMDGEWIFAFDLVQTRRRISQLLELADNPIFSKKGRRYSFHWDEQETTLILHSRTNASVFDNYRMVPHRWQPSMIRLGLPRWLNEGRRRQRLDEVEQSLIKQVTINMTSRSKCLHRTMKLTWNFHHRSKNSLINCTVPTRCISR